MKARTLYVTYEASGYGDLTWYRLNGTSMRIFTRDNLIDYARRAGFERVKVIKDEAIAVGGAA